MMQPYPNETIISATPKNKCTDLDVIDELFSIYINPLSFGFG
jgi:hypothetical protein